MINDPISYVWQKEKSRRHLKESYKTSMWKDLIISLIHYFFFLFFFFSCTNHLVLLHVMCYSVTYSVQVNLVQYWVSILSLIFNIILRHKRKRDELKVYVAEWSENSSIFAVHDFCRRKMFCTVRDVNRAPRRNSRFFSVSIYLFAIYLSCLSLMSFGLHTHVSVCMLLKEKARLP